MEISLKSLTLTHPAFATATAVTISAELVWPRPAISARMGFQTFSLRKGKASLRGTKDYERLLLKEKVDGRFGLVIGLTKPGPQWALNSAMAEILGTALSGIGSGLAAPFVSTALRPLLREPFNQLADKIEDDEPILIAEAGIDLHSEDDWVGEHKFELKTTKSLKLPLEPKAGPRTKSVAKKQKFQTIRKGTVIAEVILELRAS
ncbi:hypothetical protein [Puniceicoccus vermicola]|uniref:Uncharacterized protein n=1 Tax=Puniceicoccus vermicola TaxID=388746 RepID=A0A7X1E390_9BACT|nr:hypothetical protein [Puniceicoccus vermicola]MBC2601235.1 hypothetical protein [Puniceicoccus vermicola]